jgi:hypothetical protein
VRENSLLLPLIFELFLLGALLQLFRNRQTVTTATPAPVVNGATPMMGTWKKMVFIKKQNGIDEKNGIDGKIWYLRNKGIYEKTYI